MTLLLLAAPLGGLLTLLLYLVIFLLVAGLLFWCVRALSAAFGIPEPIKTVIIVVLVIIFVIALLYFLLNSALIGRI